jgi:O-antigen/teichoic acid export membrane protein
LPPVTTLTKIGAACFGLVIGWVTYRTLRRKEGAAQLSDISSVLAAVGGGAVTALPFDDPDVFGAYACGLAAGFFGYLAIALTVFKDKTAVSRWMGD